MDQVHVGSLVQPDTVLSGDRSPGVHTGLHDLLRCRLHATHLVLVSAVEEDVGVQVAVSGVEDVRDIQVIARSDLLDARQDLRQPGAWHGGVLDEQVGRDSSHRAEGLLATLPESGPVLRRGGQSDLGRAAVPTAITRQPGLPIEPCLQAVELDHERGPGVDRVACCEHARFHGADRRTVDDLQSRGQEPLRHDLRDGAARVFDPREDPEQRAHRLREREQPGLDLRRDPEVALGSDEQTNQVQVAGGSEATQLHRLTGRKHYGEARDVPTGDPVLQTVRSTRVLGHIPAEGAGALRGRVGRVVKAVRPGRLRQVGVDDTRLYPSRPILGIDFQNAVHPCRPDHDGIRSRQAPTGQPGARAPWHERGAGFLKRPDHPRHLPGGPWQHDGPGRPPIRGEPVRLVDHQADGVGDETGLSNGGTELGQEGLGRHAAMVQP